jgi:hypothetical protein
MHSTVLIGRQGKLRRRIQAGLQLATRTRSRSFLSIEWDDILRISEMSQSPCIRPLNPPILGDFEFGTPQN